MAPTVFMDPEHRPLPTEIASALGPAAALWESLTGYVEQSYDVEPVYGRPSKRYGWDVKYRKGGRTLLALTPDEGKFTALVVLGQKEAAGVCDLDLCEHVQTIFDEAEPLHDGRWLFVPVESGRDVQDIESLLALKRRPRTGGPTPAA